MSAVLPALLQIGALLALLALTAPILGRYLAYVYTSPRHLAPERVIYRAVGVDKDADQHWRNYLASVFGFSLASLLALYALGRLQQFLPLSLGLPALPADGAFNTAVSFVTNTNWQWYSGESTAGHLYQMTGLTVQNFVSAAVGMAVAVAFARGIARSSAAGHVGNFWVDLVRGSLRVLLPIAILGALALVALGAVQNFDAPHAISTLTGATQNPPGGPVASQEVIKVLGTNGGGFYNGNSSHPFENPSPLSNLLQIYLILIIPFAIALTFGRIVNDRRQGRAVASVMAILLTAAIGLLTWAEMAAPGTAPGAAGGAMEGKELRFGEAGTALFGAASTGTSTGAVNGMHDSLTAPGGLITMFNMQLGEIAPGGVGSGLYGMLMLAVVTVFLSGLMVGRTPQYLGKKIGKDEITLVALYVVTMPAIVLVAAALAISTDAGLAGMQESGPHGLSEVLYATTSASNNNGSAFAGLSVATPFYNTLLGFCMLIGRFLPIVFVLALAGRFAAQQKLPSDAGTLPTHKPLFIILLTGVALVLVGLTFVPVLALAPIAEALQ